MRNDLEALGGGARGTLGSVAAPAPAPIRRLRVYRNVALVAAYATAAVLMINVVQMIRFNVDVSALLKAHSPFLSDYDSSASRALAALNAVQGTHRLFLFAYPLIAVAFLTWLYVAYGNLERRGLSLRRGPGWAIGAWFIPIYAWFGPKRIVNDLWRGSHLRSEDGAEARKGKVPALVNWWWALWVGGPLAYGAGVITENGIQGGGYSTREALGLIRGASYVMTLGLVASLAALVLMAIIILRVTRAQDEG